MSTRFRKYLLISLALCFKTTVAQAHLVSTRFGDFYGGMLHPISALEHIFPWLAMGLLAGLQGPQRGRWMLLVFPMALLVGSVLAWWLPSVSVMTSLNTVSFMVLGGLVALAWSLPVSVLVILGMVFGLSHGYGNGLAMTGDMNRSLFVVGVASVGYVIITLVAALTTVIAQKRNWVMVAIRAAGSWIAAIGILLVGVKFAVG
jgi:hydrogenase/urease accessory protein HupE